MVDIRKRKEEPGATLIIYHRSEKPLEEGKNQLFDLQLADPPQVLDSSDEEDDSKSARLRAWFGNWGGWGSSDKQNVLKEKELKEAHKKVYEKNKSHLRCVPG